MLSYTVTVYLTLYSHCLTYRRSHNCLDCMTRFDFTCSTMTDADYGLHVWPCAEYLSGFILANKDFFAGKSVLEVFLLFSHPWGLFEWNFFPFQLGAGTALAGITAAKCGSKVILSDRDDKRLKNLSVSNCRQNGLTDNIKFVPVTWGRFEANLLSLPLIDIIISSDCFYDPLGNFFRRLEKIWLSKIKKNNTFLFIYAVFEPILVTVSFLMDKNPETKFYFSYQERRWF